MAGHESGKTPTDWEKSVAVALAEIQVNRNEILKAFIAKYDCGPDEVEQVFEVDNAAGNTIWYLRKKGTTS